MARPRPSQRARRRVRPALGTSPTPAIARRGARAARSATRSRRTATNTTSSAATAPWSPTGRHRGRAQQGEARIAPIRKTAGGLRRALGLGLLGRLRLLLRRGLGRVAFLGRLHRGLGRRLAAVVVLADLDPGLAGRLAGDDLALLGLGVLRDPVVGMGGGEAGAGEGHENCGREQIFPMHPNLSKGFVYRRRTSARRSLRCAVAAPGAIPPPPCNPSVSRGLLLGNGSLRVIGRRFALPGRDTSRDGADYAASPLIRPTHLP